jgi:signal transduction histidine kinase
MRVFWVDRARRELAQDLVLAAMFESIAQLDVWVLGTVNGPHLTNALILAFVAPPLFWRRRRPCGALVVSSSAVAAQALLVPGPPPSGLLYAGPILIAAYSVGAYAAWSWRAAAALGVVVVAFDGIYAPAEGLKGSLNAVLSELLWCVLPVGMWLLGRLMRSRRQSAAAKAEATRLELDREQQRRSALEYERARMARELHDVLAHSVSLMGVQAGAAEQVLARDPERTRPVLRSIQQTSRESVAELRRLLGMLRSDDLEPGLAPQPRLGELDTLVARMREAGLPVQLRIEGTARPLPAGVELAAYRVVQESLTNVLKHAQPSHVEVILRFEAATLQMSIENDGVRAAGDGTGHGLIGMIERTSLYGGTLTASAGPDGSFHVDAEIPLGTGS